jgi:sigma-54-specific transcriptional regulator
MKLAPLRITSLDVRPRALVFEDMASRELLHQIRRIAPSEATVLILGETGTGKEVVARYVHSLSRRDGQPFVPVNCGALSETLAESELFGHERGAFTGADGAKPGWFEAANGGTLFLDEVGDLPLKLQVKLLRVLQEREVVRLGSRKAVPIDVRVITATNANLNEAVAAGRFREDLFYRLNVASLRLPALRERPGDILPLAEHFLRVYGQRARLEEVSISAEFVRRLLDYSWPGNVRELENALHRAVLTCREGRIEADDFPVGSGREMALSHDASAVPDASTAALERALLELYESGEPTLFDRIASTVITTAFRFCHGNQSETARLLGISRNILRARLLQFGLLLDRRLDASSSGAPTNLVGDIGVPGRAQCGGR